MQKQLLFIILLIGTITLPTSAFGASSDPKAPVILVIGDSLSASYGIDTKQGWVSLLQKRLQQQKYPHRVVNASISGDTSHGGRNRIEQALTRHQPQTVIIELGGNDGLQGMSIDQMRENLSAMITSARQMGCKVLLIGMQLPPNYGPSYTEKFHTVYRELAQSHRVALVPYLLDGIGGSAALMQADGIHPRGAAQERMLDNVWPQLRPLL